MPCRTDCGACCDPVVLHEDVALKIFDALPHNVEPAEQDKILALWEPLGPYGDRGAVRLRCAAYDVANRACTAYDDRPKVCSRFPFYDQEGDKRTLDGRTELVCGYQADLGRTVLPIVEVT